jgi:hypothetical protein
MRKPGGKRKNLTGKLITMWIIQKKTGSRLSAPGFLVIK